MMAHYRTPSDSEGMSDAILVDSGVSAKTLSMSLKRPDTHHRIMNAALTIAFFTALVRIASVVKELTVAWRFGTSDDLDAFLISILIPVVIVSMFASAFSASFIPIYVETKEREGRTAAQFLFQSLVGWLLPLLVLVTALVVLGAPWYLPVLGSGFGADKLRFTFKLVCLNSLLIVPGGLTAAWAAPLNAERKFAITSCVPLATPLLTLGFLWVVPSWRILALIAGVLAGIVTELVLLGTSLQRLGCSLVPRWPRIDPNIRRVAGQFLPLMSGTILNSGNVMVDGAMAAMLAAGSVSALNYGNRVVQFPLGLASAALGTALVPYLSSMAAARNWVELDRTVRRYIALTFLITLPLTACLFFFSTPIVKLLFYRGAFVADDVRLVSRVQAFYALQIPSYLVSIIVVRLISSLQANQLLLFATIINLLTNIVLNYAFMHWLGLPGIALSTSVVYLLSTILWYFIIMKRLRRMAGAAN